MNARSLLHFFSLRCCRRAQWEIRRMAELMLLEVQKAAPLLFAKAGPTCVTEGYCGEGEFTCGRLKMLQSKNIEE
jgi:thymidylate synthase (FAD)